MTLGDGQVRVTAEDEVLRQLWGHHYRGLVRLAALLLRDAAWAEDVVQEAYVSVCSKPRNLRDADHALAYLRRSVMNACRSEGRHRSVVRRHELRLAAEPERVHDSAETAALAGLARSDVRKALADLPARQREAVVLRYYGGLTESQTADLMGISVGTVKSSCSRALSALAISLGGAR
jgi:RNA polymerase sigma-70 factor (sigma-E family)